MTPRNFHNIDEVKHRRRSLRKKLTLAEAVLWDLLKSRKLERRKFRRQHSIGKYILDFYCPAERLAIELDGEHHFTDQGRKYDENRTNYINSLRIKVLRFENQEVFQSPEEVLLEIKRNFREDGVGQGLIQD